MFGGFGIVCFLFLDIVWVASEWRPESAMERWRAHEGGAQKEEEPNVRYTRRMFGAPEHLWCVPKKGRFNSTYAYTPPLNP